MSAEFSEGVSYDHTSNFEQYADTGGTSEALEGIATPSEGLGVSTSADYLADTATTLDVPTTTSDLYPGTYPGGYHPPGAIGDTDQSSRPPKLGELVPCSAPRFGASLASDSAQTGIPGVDYPDPLRLGRLSPFVRGIRDTPHLMEQISGTPAPVTGTAPETQLPPQFAQLNDRSISDPEGQQLAATANAEDMSTAAADLGSASDASANTWPDLSDTKIEAGVEVLEGEIVDPTDTQQPDLHRDELPPLPPSSERFIPNPATVPSENVTPPSPSPWSFGSRSGASADYGAGATSDHQTPPAYTDPIPDTVPVSPSAWGDFGPPESHEAPSETGNMSDAADATAAASDIPPSATTTPEESPDPDWARRPLVEASSEALRDDDGSTDTGTGNVGDAPPVPPPTLPPTKSSAAADQYPPGWGRQGGQQDTGRRYPVEEDSFPRRLIKETGIMALGGIASLGSVLSVAKAEIIGRGSRGGYAVKVTNGQSQETVVNLPKYIKSKRLARVVARALAPWSKPTLN